MDSEYDEGIASKLVSELEGKVVHEVVKAGKEKLKGFGGGGGGGGGAAPAAEKKEGPANRGHDANVIAAAIVFQIPSWLGS